MREWIAANWIEGVGIAAAIAGLYSTYSRTMIPLRIASMVANVLFIAYGALRGTYPTVVVNCILLPLNFIRLSDIRKLIRDVRTAASGDLNADWLRSFVTRKRYLAGEVLWRDGDRATEAFYVFSGEVDLPEIGKRLGPGTLIGEMGLFDQDGRRGASAVCATDCEVGSITYDEFRLLYYQNPEFGYYLLHLITRRMSENIGQTKGLPIG
ncbi:MAG: cyclic nucleotide-binding domain-containing protein [Hyphomicrobiaceae bacterium]